ncbi:hypothetical protein [Umezawaea sp. Da 62-37]|uniref:hypothetical protein n=1 Tax=Umezawaea sp. Da 62-37 TaxID=3075927 RepID=UPI0028F6F7AA|nr:hypothetical protein [Umezawaea sp. Da 62-37]WNV85219.1 hypothetical protein RM788_45015 [Umezawaea sp. Da 62-37]
MTGIADMEGKRFRRPGDTSGAVAVYHEDGDVVWAVVEGGEVRRGSVTGNRAADGVLRMGYTIVLASGEIICGFSVSTPEVTEQGVLRLREEWERFGLHAASGVSYIEEVVR